MKQKILEVRNCTKVQLPELVISFARMLSPGAVVYLKGIMGSGKSTFVFEFCKIKGLGSTHSPTFTIHNRYENSEFAVDHFDLFRLSNEDEVEASGFYDLINQPADVKFIEWPERLRETVTCGSEKIFQIEFTIPVNSESRDIVVYILS